MIKRQLAHAERNKVRAANNRAQYLDALKAGGNVIPMQRKAG